MRRAIAAVKAAAAIREEERVLAGQAGGAVWVIASLSVVAMALVLPGSQPHAPVVLALGVVGCLWGSFSGLFLDYRRLPVWLIHLSLFAGTVSIGLVLALSGGSRSPAWVCLFYVIIFAAYFLRPPAAAAYFLACVGIEIGALLLTSDAGRAAQSARAVVAAPAFIVLGGAIVTGKGFMWRLRSEAERLAAEQGALRRVATAVVNGEPPERFYQLVALEAGQLLSAATAAILRFDGLSEAIILGAWGRTEDGQSRPGDRISLASRSDLAQAIAEDRPSRTLGHDPDSVGPGDSGSSIVTPIKVSGRAWGFLAVASEGAASLTAEHERRLSEFAELISAAITSIEDRATLAAQASTDPLTGVANHRAFRQRLIADLARARRYGTPVSVAMIDVDHFKLVNDAGGHEAGDEMLVRVARCLTDATRAEDTLARVGGDEFAWILPETQAQEARVAVERARQLILAPREGRPPVTISGGVADSTWTSDPTELVRLADRALYASKESGRDQVQVYSARGLGSDELAPH